MQPVALTRPTTPFESSAGERGWVQRQAGQAGFGIAKQGYACKFGQNNVTNLHEKHSLKWLALTMGEQAGRSAHSAIAPPSLRQETIQDFKFYKFYKF